MFCQYCGAEIEVGSKFCTSCGRAQEDDVLRRTGGPDESDVTLATSYESPAEPPISQTQGKPWLIPLVLLAVLALLAMLFVGAWQFGWFGPTLQGRLNELTGMAAGAEQAESPQESRADAAQEADTQPGGSGQTMTEESAGGNAAGDTSSKGNQSDSNGSDRTDSDASGKAGATDSDASGKAGATDTSASGGVTVRSSLSEYSWDELSHIAKEIESEYSLADALAVAKDYNLITDTGAYTGTTKDIRLSDGKTMHMRLVGMWHDRADTDSGKAGLSFLSDGVVARHRMHSQATIPGGWEHSEMRTWLQQDLINMLPDEVSSAILPVYKKTNNEGEARTTFCVSDTKDTLWLPSIVELCGPVDWEYESDPSNSDLYNSIFNAEGAQYGAFARETIDNFNSNTVFALGGEWWMRSVAPAKGKGRYVDGSGDPSWYADANEDRGVVVGFCL